MDVIGNNISNVNTIGYKASRVTFQEIFSQTLRTAVSPSPDGDRGGINPQQVGLGISIASIDVLHQRGSVQRTDNMTDLAIDGEGFFALADGDRRFFTRAGNLRLDVGGYLTVPNGMKVLGWSGNDRAEKLQATAQPINLANQFMAAAPTDRIVFQGNLDSRLAVGESIRHGVTLFDSLGGEHRVDFVFTRQATVAGTPTLTPWTVAMVAERGGAITAINGVTATPAVPADPMPLIPLATLNFDEYGRLVVGLDGVTMVPEITFTLDDAMTGSADIVIPETIVRRTPPPGGADITLEGNTIFDLERFTQYAVESSVRASEVSGFPAGSLTSLSINNAGSVIGVFSNGQLNELALLAIANFNNPSGLMKLGDNLFENTVNAGYLGLDTAGLAGRGQISPGTLEMSNVDLAKEFTDMIVAQRGFQANSRIITTSDELLQELVNIKR
jgi:flagellar hook protein FlgE